MQNLHAMLLLVGVAEYALVTASALNYGAKGMCDNLWWQQYSKSHTKENYS